MPVSSCTTGNGISPRNALRISHTSAVLSLPIDHNTQQGANRRYASRMIAIAAVSSSSSRQREAFRMQAVEKLFASDRKPRRATCPTGFAACFLPCRSLLERDLEPG